MFADSKPEDHKSSGSRVCHALAAIIEKAGKWNLAKRKDSVGDFLPKSRLGEIKSYGTALGPAW